MPPTWLCRYKESSPHTLWDWYLGTSLCPQEPSSPETQLSWDLGSSCQPLLEQESTDLKGKDILDQSVPEDKAGAGHRVAQEDLGDANTGSGTRKKGGGTMAETRME